jgi:membrane-anchored glycerophosphoryl diester phosphodiesterase (GDPDase)
MTTAGWLNYAFMVAITVIVFRLVFWLPLKAKKIENRKASKQMRQSWRRTWDRLGRLEARHRARKGAKTR